MKNEFMDLIIDKLNTDKARLQHDFMQAHPYEIARHFILDDLLPTKLAMEVYSQFPKPKQMRKLHSYGELKMKYSPIGQVSPLLKDLHAAIQDTKVVAAIEYITGIKRQLPDQSRLAGGVSTLLKGHYINPHLDNSHDIDKKFYRTVNLLYYVSPDWQLENGGNYELWDTAIQHRIIVPSLFNRLVVMETNTTSWHAVNPVLCDAPRCCVFNYYFSEQSPEGRDYFHTASSLFYNPLIKPRPEQTIRRFITTLKAAVFAK